MRDLTGDSSDLIKNRNPDSTLSKFSNIQGQSDLGSKLQHFNGMVADYSRVI
jgi:hypothetical protein